MFHTGRDVNDRPRENLLSRLSPFLIPASTCHTDKHLSSSPGGLMDVPVVAATRFKGNIDNGDLLVGNLCKITIPFEISCIFFSLSADCRFHQSGLSEALTLA